MKSPHLQELGEFLKARRGELTPDDVGLPSRPGAMRRVNGLRREEVAGLVAVSTDYYTRIEQGRLAPSEPVLDALERVLRLSPDQRSYVWNLLRQVDRRTVPRRRANPVRTQVQRMLDRMVDTPAFVVGKYMDILAWNPLAGALLIDVAQLPVRERNYVRMMFADPRMRDFYPDWEAMARTCVALLRMQAAENPQDARLAALVGELSVTDPQFGRWWAARQVASEDFGTKTVRHPALGDLIVDWDAFTWAGDPDQQLIVWSPALGSPTEDKLRILSSWIATAPARGGTARAFNTQDAERGTESDLQS